MHAPGPNAGVLCLGGGKHLVRLLVLVGLVGTASARATLLPGSAVAPPEATNSFILAALSPVWLGTVITAPAGTPPRLTPDWVAAALRMLTNRSELSTNAEADATGEMEEALLSGRPPERPVASGDGLTEQTGYEGTGFQGAGSPAGVPGALYPSGGNSPCGPTTSPTLSLGGGSSESLAWPSGRIGKALQDELGRARFTPIPEPGTKLAGGLLLLLLGVRLVWGGSTPTRT